MPKSAARDRRREVERLIARLSRAVDTLGAFEAENRRLSETLARAKRKAVRLQSRLALVEDEV